MKQAKCDQEKWNKAINHAQRVLEIVGKEADRGWRCGPVGCGTVTASPPIDSGRGPMRIAAAAQARAVVMPVETSLP